MLVNRDTGDIAFPREASGTLNTKLFHSLGKRSQILCHNMSDYGKGKMQLPSWNFNAL